MSADAATPGIEAPAAIVERPDGYHWTDESGRQEFGPFESANDALQDMAGDDGRHADEIDALSVAEPEFDVDAARGSAQDDTPVEDT